MHLFAVAMVWQHEPIKLHICPPTGTQVREYVAMRGRHASGVQAQIPGGEVVSQSSPSEPHPEGGAQPQLHLAIGDVNDAQLREALGELQLETSRKE